MSICKRHRLSVLAAALVLSACGPNENPAEDRTAEFIGTWQYQQGSTTETYTFNADRTYVFDRMAQSDPRRVTGTYVARGHVLTLDGTDQTGRRVVDEPPYFINSTGLGFGLLPEGPHQGPVGSWRADEKIVTYDTAGNIVSTVNSGLRLILNADGSAQGSTSPDRPSDLGTGTWEQDTTGDYAITIRSSGPSPSVVRYSFGLFADAILTQRVFTKLAPGATISAARHEEVGQVSLTRSGG